MTHEIPRGNIVDGIVIVMMTEKENEIAVVVDVLIAKVLQKNAKKDVVVAIEKKEM